MAKTITITVLDTVHKKEKPGFIINIQKPANIGRLLEEFNPDMLYNPDGGLNFENVSDVAQKFMDVANEKNITVYAPDAKSLIQIITNQTK